MPHDDSDGHKHQPHRGHTDGAGRGHSHGHSHGAGIQNEHRLLIAAALTTVTMLAEAIGGVVSGSLALLADAGHMLTDAAALVLAWLAMRFARRPADWKRTYGFQRFEVLAAFSNGLALFFISGMICYEAIERMYDPIEVLGTPMLIIAAVGLAVNLITLLVLRHDGANLNVRAALLHVMSDLLGSVAAIVAALVILQTGWTPIDPILSIVITLLILRSAWLITKDAGHILLEGAPTGIDVREVQRDLEATVPDVQSVHHVHAWSLSENRPVMTLHALTCDSVPPERVAAAIKARLKEAFGVVHATVEVEHRDCADGTPAKSCGKV
jgi:cobalt-zinc-cadmium efflux system protein